MRKPKPIHRTVTTRAQRSTPEAHQAATWWRHPTLLAAMVHAFGNLVSLAHDLSKLWLP